MSFAPIEQWQSGMPPPLAVYRPLVLSYSPPLWLSNIQQQSARWRLERPLGLVLASTVAMSVLGTLAGITQVALPQMVDRYPLVLQLIVPEQSTALASAGAAAGAAVEMAQSPVPPSPIETSTPTPISPPEWRVSRVPRLGPARPGPIATNGVSGVGVGGRTSGVGGGGLGAYDPYAGAAPRWRPSASIRPDGIDEVQLQAAIAEVKRRYPNARGTVDLRVRLSPGGMVLDVEFVSAITPALAAALRRALVGKPIALKSGDEIGGSVTDRALTGIVIG
ncbi:MAG: hypothetical protein HC788_05090 [Sphingopyxis sp.]|nr:hypothetical protein [Sphingopyxis sp.]